MQSSILCAPRGAIWRKHVYTLPKWRHWRMWPKKWCSHCTQEHQHIIVPTYVWNIDLKCCTSRTRTITHTWRMPFMLCKCCRFVAIRGRSWPFTNVRSDANAVDSRPFVARPIRYFVAIFFFFIKTEPYKGITPGCAASDLVWHHQNYW